MESDQTQFRFAARFDQERDAIARLLATDAALLGPGAAGNLKLLQRMGTVGIEAAIRKRQAAGQAAARRLVDEFLIDGAKAALLPGPQRGGDFLDNQLRGQWAERVALSMAVDGLILVPFGPSGAAMPGEQDHRRIVRTFKEIQLLEGKRPDLLAFDAAVWERLSAIEKDKVKTWPERRLEAEDDALVKQARCGIEVKNSLWHYGKRRESGGGPLSITMKEEEVELLRSWRTRTGLPVLFLQVLFYEIYCMGFRRMEEGMAQGHVHAPGDYERQEPKDEKPRHMFRIVPPLHLCGKVRFPSESTASVVVLEDGSVIPRIDLKPAQAFDVVSAPIHDEINHGAAPPTPAP